MNDGWVTMEVRGLKELTALFKRLPEEVGKRTLKQSLMKAARPLVDNMRARTPVEHRVTHGPSKREHAQPGDLKRSIRARYGRTKEATEAKVLVGTNLFYSYFVEFGTRHQPAQHFMRDAFHESVDEIVDTFVDETGKALDRAVARYGAKKP